MSRRQRAGPPPSCHSFCSPSFKPHAPPIAGAGLVRARVSSSDGRGERAAVHGPAERAAAAREHKPCERAAAASIRWRHAAREARAAVGPLGISAAVAGRAHFGAAGAIRLSQHRMV